MFFFFCFFVVVKLGKASPTLTSEVEILSHTDIYKIHRIMACTRNVEGYLWCCLNNKKTIRGENMEKKEENSKLV